jgi:hypothetical protein
MLNMPFWLALRAEALHVAERNSEALRTLEEAQTWVERSEERWGSAELHRLRAVLLAATGGNNAEIEAAFHAAISTAKQQKSLSLEKRAETSYAEYRRQKASDCTEDGLRLPLN